MKVNVAPVPSGLVKVVKGPDTEETPLKSVANPVVAPEAPETEKRQLMAVLYRAGLVHEFKVVAVVGMP